MTQHLSEIGQRVRELVLQDLEIGRLRLLVAQEVLYFACSQKRYEIPSLAEKVDPHEMFEEAWSLAKQKVFQEWPEIVAAVPKRKLESL